MSRCTAARRTASSSACRSANRWRAWRQETPTSLIDATGIAPEGCETAARPAVSDRHGAEPLQLARIDEERRVPCARSADAAADYPQRGVPRVSIDQNGNLCLNMGPGYQVRPGPAVQLKEKLPPLPRWSAAYPISARCQYIDLSCLEAPAWKPRSCPGDQRPRRRVATRRSTGETLHGRGGTCTRLKRIESICVNGCGMQCFFLCHRRAACRMPAHAAPMARGSRTASGVRRSSPSI